MTETKLLQYKGLIALHDYGEAMNVLFLSDLDDPLAIVLEEEIADKVVSVSYWITDQKCTHEEAQREFLKRLSGVAECEFQSQYSEITGYLWTDEEINIGGHDLLQELKSHIGKWLLLDIAIKEEKNE